MEEMVFQIGPIRPPSEANSLLLRVTINCPWNKCKFCMLYKKYDFHTRPVEDVKKDIDLVQLQARIPVVMERAASHPVPVCMDSVMLRSLSCCDGLLHSFKYIQIYPSLKKKHLTFSD